MDQTPTHRFELRDPPPIAQKIEPPFYVGIGFCSHLPDTLDTAVVSNVVLENAAGKVH